MKDTKIEINGKAYGLAFCTYTMQLLEDDLGSISTVFDNLKNGKQAIKTVCAMFTAMANTYNELHGIDEKVDGKVVKFLPMAEFQAVQAAVMTAMNAGMRTTPNDEEAEDEFLAEARKKEEGGTAAVQ